VTALKRNVAANVLGQGWSALMGLAFIPVYIQYLGIEAYGLIGLFAVLQTWLNLLDMGLGQTLGREMARFTSGYHSPQSIRNLLRSLEVIMYAMAVLMAAAIVFSSGWMAGDWLKVETLPVSDVSHALSITALVISLRFVEGLYRNAIFGLQRQVWFNGVNALLSTLRFVGVIAVLAFVSPTISAFFQWQAFISLVAVGVYARKLHNLLPESPERGHLSLSAVRAVMAFAGGMFGINALAVILTQIDKVLLSRLLTLEYFGYYVLAATLAGGISLIVGPITQAFYPRMVELSAIGGEQEFSRLYHQGAQLVTLASATIMPLLFLFPEGVLYVWSGDVQLVEKTAPIMVPLVLGSFLNGLMWMPYQSQLANGWTRLGLMVNTVAVSVLVPAILVLVPVYGALAAAWIWAALNISYVIVVVQLMHRRILLLEKYRWYVADVIRPLIGALSALLLLKYAVLPELGGLGRVEWGVFLVVAALVSALATLRLCDELWPFVRTMAADAMKGSLASR
jgi:O-antigen/teichoic acid export membrane protein